jgi:hypothetical protein
MRKRLVPAISVTLLLLLFSAALFAAQDDSGQTTATDKVASAFLPVTIWEFDPVVDGQAVTHDFVIQNKGNAPLNISRVKTG